MFPNIFFFKSNKSHINGSDKLLSCILVINISLLLLHLIMLISGKYYQLKN